MAWLRLLPIPVLLWTIVGATVVAPPANVTFRCHNFTNLLQWSYHNMQQPGLKFRVDVYSKTNRPKEIWIDPPTLQAEIVSSYSEVESYMVQVTAVIGQNESAPSPDDGITFSYGQNVVDVMYTCSVDLPPVNITTKPDDIVVFRFEHPWMVYRQKMSNTDKPKSKSVMKRHESHSQRRKSLPEFKYDVVIVHQEEKHFTFSCETEVCEQTLPVHTEQQLHCLKFSGTMKQVLVEGRQPYCAQPIPEPFNGEVYLYVGIPVAVLATAVLIVYMVYRKTTKPSVTMPPKFERIDNQRPQQIMQTFPDPVILVEPTTPTLLLEDTDDDRKDLTLDVDPFHGNGRHSLSVMQHEDHGVSDSSGVAEEPKDESDYMAGNKMDEDDMLPEESAYERRSVLVALGPDDVTEGYRG